MPPYVSTSPIHLSNVATLHRENSAFNSINDFLHHILANIVRTVHVIEVVIMLIFHKVVSEAFKYFQQDGYSFDKIALA